MKAVNDSIVNRYLFFYNWEKKNVFKEFSKLYFCPAIQDTDISVKILKENVDFSNGLYLLNF